MAQDKQERAYMAKAGAQALDKPKKRVDPYVIIGSEILVTEAYKALSYSARAMLVELLHFYTGTNNGRIFIAPEMLRDRGFSKNTATKAFRELCAIGFIYMTRRGGSKLGLCSWYALTWHPLDKSEGMYLNGFVSKKFLKYIPEEKNKRSEIGIGSPKNWDSSKITASKGNAKKSLGKMRAPKNCDDSIPNTNHYLHVAMYRPNLLNALNGDTLDNWVQKNGVRLKKIGRASPLQTIH
ncbi:hypothetical protein ICN32_00815 [Polynucleobacter wuianus]|uniref:hypothetical protein n=1 Tax=Polynucleobacter wuianus TaxID=1743168 RepID=UPI001C0D1C23|nr:hypothetical protein [Polynucleobacter wuianus]MBU3609099.1 hypothetical protein [Polynucleobacter wuianus]